MILAIVKSIDGVPIRLTESDGMNTLFLTVHI